MSIDDNVLKDFEDFLIAGDAADNTIKAYLSDLRQLSVWLIERGGSLLDMAPQDLRDYRQRFTATATFNRKLVAVKRFTAWAYDTDRADHDPAKSIKTMRRVRSAPRKLTDVEVGKLVRAIERYGTARDKAIVLLMLNTGLRVSEVSHLKIADVEIRERSGRLTVRAGKGNKTREVPLNLTARQALTEYLGPAPDRGYVFPGRAEGQPLATGSIRAMLIGYCRLGGIEPINPHALRHRFAYQLRKTQGIEVVARLLGHENISTTAIYTDPTQEDLQKAVDRLAD